MKKEMKVDYLDFLDRFESSGLTQGAFGKREGMSSSMVSYYVRRGRDLQQEDAGSTFAEVRLTSGGGLKFIKISYPSGVEVELPL